MQQFRISEEGIKELSKKMIVRVVVVMGVAVTTGITISVLNQTGDKTGLAIFIPLMAALLAFNLYNVNKKAKLTLQSYRLTIQDNVITREQMHLLPLSISLIEIKEIAKNKNGSFTISGLAPNDIIYVPAQIDNAEALQTVLNSMHSITVKTTESFWQKYAPLLLLAIVPLMLGVYVATNKIIVGVCGVATLVIFSFSFYRMQTDKNVAVKVKRKSWLMLLVAASILFTMIVKIFAQG
jgi:hypothetical protein